MKCVKVAYRTQEDADKDILRIKKRSTRPTVPSRSYKCKHCGSWHLTSKPTLQDQITTANESNAELKKEIRLTSLKLKAALEKISLLEEKLKDSRKKIAYKNSQIAGLRKLNNIKRNVSTTLQSGKNDGTDKVSEA